METEWDEGLMRCRTREEVVPSVVEKCLGSARVRSVFVLAVGA